MLERSFPSKKEIFTHIGMATRIESQLGDVEHGCLPSTLAFTHGELIAQLDNKYLHAPTIEEAIDGARILADLSNQEFAHSTFDAVDEDQLNEELREVFSKAISCWIAYMSPKDKIRGLGLDDPHIIGVIPTDNNQLGIWDTDNITSHFSRVTTEELSKLLIQKRHKRFNKIHIYSFT